MATLQLEVAALTVGRPPEAIERWILDGKVEAERAGDTWLVEMRSLLNATTAEDVTANGNGHARPEPTTPLQSEPDVGGAAGPSAETSRAVAIVEPPPPPTPAPTYQDRAIADVATVAIQALNARLEQAIGEVERLQDERLKLALQLGYAQAQLKACNDQLKALAGPAEPSMIVRLWRRLTGRTTEQPAS